jgi:hypothetical protein
MEQLDLDFEGCAVDPVRPKSHLNPQIPKNRDKKQGNVKPKTILFSRKPYDTDFFYYTEVVTDFAVKSRK